MPSLVPAIARIFLNFQYFRKVELWYIANALRRKSFTTALKLLGNSWPLSASYISSAQHRVLNTWLNICRMKEV